ncbi:MAG: hypothetical protein ACRDJF_08020 [Actinomycetota bacterium]
MGRLPRCPNGERGLSTAELLGNAALGIAVLVIIWAGVRHLGDDIIQFIRDQIFQFR